MIAAMVAQNKHFAFFFVAALRKNCACYQQKKSVDFSRKKLIFMGGVDRDVWKVVLEEIFILKDICVKTVANT